MTRYLAVIWAIFALLGCATPAEKGDHIAVTVVGVVLKPGKYSLPAGSDLKQAVEHAGGIERFAIRYRIRIIHQDSSFEDCYSQEAGKAYVLSDGDLVVVEDGTL